MDNSVSLYKCSRCGCKFTSHSDTRVLTIPCRNCGGRVVVDQSTFVQNDNPDLTEILERGIAAKRAGNLTQAIALYKEAQRIDPTDTRAYGNLGKTLIGTQQYADSLRNWLILCEINRFNASGGTLAYASQLSRFVAHPLIWNEHVIDETVVTSILRRKPYLGELIYRADNLTLYIGHCVIRQQPNATMSYNIPIDMMDNLESSLIGRLIGNDLRNSRWDHVFLLAGFYFAAINMKASDADIASAAATYLNPNFNLSFALETAMMQKEQSPADNDQSCADVATTNNLLEILTSKLALNIKEKYNLIGIKWGHEQVQSSVDKSVHTIASMLGYSSAEENASGDTTFLCWTAVPVDDDNYCIKPDSDKVAEALFMHPSNSTARLLGELKYQRHLTSIDTVAEYISKLMESRVFPGMNVIMEGGIKYRQLFWLSII